MDPQPIPPDRQAVQDALVYRQIAPAPTRQGSPEGYGDVQVDSPIIRGEPENRRISSAESSGSLLVYIVVSGQLRLATILGSAQAAV